MTAIDSLHIASVRSFLQGSERQGVPASAIFEKAGLDPAILNQQDARFPAAQAGLLMQTISHTLNDETLGFFDRPTRAGSIEMSLYASITTETLEEAVRRFGKFWQLLHDECNFALKISGEEAKLIFKFSRPELYQQVSFMTWIVFYLTRYCSWLIDQPFIVDRLYLPFPSTHEADDYPNMFPSHFYFDQNEMSLVFHSRYLEKHVKRGARDVPEFAAITSNLMSTHRIDDSLSGRVRRMLNNMDNVDALPLKVVADNFGKSPETIRRKLKEEGTSYAEIKESVRHEIAVYQLRYSDISINQIAYNVGFSDPSAFHRAFKRWTGQTPGDYRSEQA